MSEEATPNDVPTRNGWTRVFWCLPFAAALQYVFLPGLSYRTFVAAIFSYAALDGIVLLRALVGYFFQPASREWRFWCVFLWLSNFPLIMLMSALYSLYTEMGGKS